MVSITQALENWTLPHRDWKTAAPMPKPLLESAATVVGDKLYVFGGFTLGWKASRSVFAYDFTTDDWQQLPDLPTPVTHVNVAMEGGRLWLAGGFVGDHPGKATAEVWQCDLKTQQWVTAPPLPQPRAGGGLCAIGKVLHYFGGFGCDRDSTHADHWSLSLDGADTWVAAPPLPEVRGHVSTVVLNNKVYAIGGQIRHDTNPIDQDSVFLFDPNTYQWCSASAMPEPRSHFEATTFTLEDYIVITGGRNNQNPVLLKDQLFNHSRDRSIDDLPLQLFLKLKSSDYQTDVLPNISVYDTRRDRWLDVSALPTRLYGPVANVIGQCVIVTGGGRIRHRNMQTRTLLNESLVDLIYQKLSS